MIRRLIALVGLAGIAVSFAGAIFYWRRFTHQICGPRGGINAEGVANCYAMQEQNIVPLSIIFGAAALVLLAAILLPSQRSARN